MNTSLDNCFCFHEDSRSNEVFNLKYERPFTSRNLKDVYMKTFYAGWQQFWTIRI